MMYIYAGEAKHFLPIEFTQQSEIRSLQADFG